MQYTKLDDINDHNGIDNSTHNNALEKISSPENGSDVRVDDAKSRKVFEDSSDLSERLTSDSHDLINPENPGGEDDPFYVFRDDLLRKIGMIDESLSVYTGLIKNTDTSMNATEVKEVKKQLKRHIKHAEGTLRDLSTTIRLVEKQRSKFIGIHDIEERRNTLEEARIKIDRAKQEMNSESLRDKITQDEKARAARRLGEESNGDSFLVDQTAQASMLLRRQDETLDELDEAVVRVGYMAEGMHIELDEQNRMLDNLDDDLSDVEERLGFVMGKLGKLLKTKNRCQLGIIIFLVFVVIVLFFLVLYS